MADNRVLKRAKENKESLREMQARPALSDVFAQAMVGFLPLIAGLGSSEDAAALAPVGLQAMQQMAQGQREERARDDALNEAALTEAQASENASNKAYTQEQMNARQKESIAARRSLAEMNNAAKSGFIDKRIQGQKDLVGVRNAAEVDSAFDIAEQKVVAQKAVEWEAAGKGTAKKSIDSLEDAIKTLQKNPNLVGRGTGVLPDFATSQKVLDQRQNVHSALLSGIKATFPGAISDKETEIFVNTHYNEQASAEQNIKSLKRAIASMKENSARLDQMSRGGTIKAAQKQPSLEELRQERNKRQQAK